MDWGGRSCLKVFDRGERNCEMVPNSQDHGGRIQDFGSEWQTMPREVDLYVILDIITISLKT